jgi:hypothetical protein
VATRAAVATRTRVAVATRTRAAGGTTADLAPLGVDLALGERLTGSPWGSQQTKRENKGRSGSDGRSGSPFAEAHLERSSRGVSASEWPVVREVA